MSHNPAMKISFSAIAVYLVMAIVAIGAGAGLVANLVSIWEISAIEFGWS